MAQINEVKVSWQNWPGAPGVSSFYFDSGAGFDIAFVRSFFNAIVAMLPSGLTLTVPSSGDIIEDTTGVLAGSWSQPAVAVVTGTGTGVYAGPSGMLVHWLTNGVVNGRRVRGRSFIVPVVTGQYDAFGSPTTTAINTLKAAADGLVTSAAGSLKVWSRPSPFRAGSSHAVTSTRVPDLAVVMRSRRV